MVIIQALLTLIVHSFGRVVNMAFSWATVMLFGRVPQERQIFLSIVAFGGGRGTEALEGSIDQTAIFKAIRDQL